MLEWLANEKHLSASQQNNFTKYNLGEILLVDLGWNNYDRKFAYIHPAVVIKETATKIFIVPCSSGTPRKDKNNNIYPDQDLVKHLINSLIKFIINCLSKYLNLYIIKCRN